MVDSFTIRNFRSFDEVKVDNCRRINILVGDNGSGKTALLEALFLAAGLSPELALRTRYWRGGESLTLSGEVEDINAALWNDLFHNFHFSHSAVISLKGKGEHNRSVTISANPVGSKRIIPPSRNNPRERPKVVALDVPIEFKWDILGHIEVVQPYLDGSKLIIPPIPGKHVKASFFAANQTAPATETANSFSRLSKQMLEKEFIARYQLIYNRISNLSIELNAGAPMLFAEVEGLSQKIPISLASGGMYKLASIMLAMARQVGGIVVVDELENGFYFKKMPEIWKTLLEFSRLYDCQVFASTHSAECLRAAAEIAKDNKSDFCLLRTVLGSNGTLVRHIAGSKFSDAIMDEVELR